MMSKLTQKHDEATRLLTCYLMYRDSDDEAMRRKAHLDLDRFLMENRELAITCIEQVLDATIKELKPKRPGLLKRLFTKGDKQHEHKEGTHNSEHILPGNNVHSHRSGVLGAEANPR